MPTGESEYRDIISWKNKQKNQCVQCEVEEDGENRKRGGEGQLWRGWTDEIRVQGERYGCVLHVV